MSEYWKSTPTYWCKHCKTYVRDTKISKSQHESTPRHQGNIQRSLRTLHRDSEREERDKARAKVEVERLNGIVCGNGVGGGKSGAAGIGVVVGNARQRAVKEEKARQPDPAERKRQIQQLAEMGIAVPAEYRKDMALTGDWETIATKPLPQDPLPPGAKSFGVRKRKIEDGEDEENVDVEKRTEAEGDWMEGARRENRAWGSRMKTWKKEDEGDVDIATLMGGGANESVKTEDEGVAGEVIAENGQAQQPAVKREDSDAAKMPIPSVGDEETPAAPVVFKKRKAKVAKT